MDYLQDLCIHVISCGGSPERCFWAVANSSSQTSLSGHGMGLWHCQAPEVLHLRYCHVLKTWEMTFWLRRKVLHGTAQLSLIIAIVTPEEIRGIAAIKWIHRNFCWWRAMPEVLLLLLRQSSKGKQREIPREDSFFASAMCFSSACSDERHPEGMQMRMRKKPSAWGGGAALLCRGEDPAQLLWVHLKLNRSALQSLATLLLPA